MGPSPTRSGHPPRPEMPPPHIPAHRGAARVWPVGLDWTSALTTAPLPVCARRTLGWTLMEDGSIPGEEATERVDSWHLHLCALQHPGDHGPVCPARLVLKVRPGCAGASRVGRRSSWGNAWCHGLACPLRTPVLRCYRAGSTGRRLAGAAHPCAAAGDPFPRHHLEDTPGLQGSWGVWWGPTPRIT